MKSLDLDDLRKKLSYDPVTGEFRWLTRVSSTAGAGDIAGCVNLVTGYRHISIGGKLYKAHRLAFLIVTGKTPVLSVDHINGQRDDNRWSNLREASHACNSQNQRRAHSNNPVGVLGVTQRGTRFRSNITVKGEKVFLGSFKTAEEASSAYQSAKLKYHEGVPQ